MQQRMLRRLSAALLLCAPSVESFNHVYRANYGTVPRPASRFLESVTLQSSDKISSAGFNDFATYKSTIRKHSDVIRMADISKDKQGSPSKDIGKNVVYSETTMRSLAKAVVWRLTAAVITLVSGLVFSKSLATAASIVTSDFVTKSGFMFLGERVWNKVNWGKGKKEDGAQRSLAKALLWRVFAAANTLICGTFLAKDFTVAMKIAGSDTIMKTGLFYVNERIWARIEWGKEYDIDFVI